MIILLPQKHLNQIKQNRILRDLQDQIFVELRLIPGQLFDRFVYVLKYLKNELHFLNAHQADTIIHLEKWIARYQNLLPYCLFLRANAGTYSTFLKKKDRNSVV